MSNHSLESFGPSIPEKECRRLYGLNPSKAVEFRLLIRAAERQYITWYRVLDMMQKHLGIESGDER